MDKKSFLAYNALWVKSHDRNHSLVHNISTNTHIFTQMNNLFIKHNTIYQIMIMKTIVIGHGRMITVVPSPSCHVGRNQSWVTDHGQQYTK